MRKLKVWSNENNVQGMAFRTCINIKIWLIDFSEWPCESGTCCLVHILTIRPFLFSLVQYAELKPVPCLTYSDAQNLREKCATPILKQVISLRLISITMQGVILSVFLRFSFPFLEIGNMSFFLMSLIELLSSGIIITMSMAPYCVYNVYLFPSGQSFCRKLWL